MNEQKRKIIFVFIYLNLELIQTEKNWCRNQDSYLGYHGHNVGS
jgi:hypothetical protein